MNMFIEVTEIESGEKGLVSVSEIRSISRPDGKNVFIETNYDVKGGSIGVYVRESYDEVRCKLDKMSLIV